MGAVVRSFAELNGSPDTAWLVGYPYWADSRLVMINAGYPSRDNAIWPQSFQDTVNDPRAKLFIINDNDVDDKNALQALYPNGWLTEFQSKYETKNFLLFFVPAQSTSTQCSPCHDPLPLDANVHGFMMFSFCLCWLWQAICV
jgi:hypothetical protein